MRACGKGVPASPPSCYGCGRPRTGDRHDLSLLQRRDRRQHRACPAQARRRTQHDGAGILARAARNRARDRRRSESTRHRDLFDRQAFLRRHGSLGVHGGARRSTDRNAGAGRSAANLRRHVLDIQETFNVIDRARIPVLIAIQGGCIGGAVDLVQRLRLPLCHCRRVLRRAGDQYRHDGGCRHLPAPVQSDPAGLGARACLFGPPPAGAEGERDRPRQRGVRHAGRDARGM